MHITCLPNFVLQTKNLKCFATLRYRGKYFSLSKSIMLSKIKSNWELNSDKKSLALTKTLTTTLKAISVLPERPEYRFDQFQGTSP